MTTFSFTLTIRGLPEIPAEVPYEEYVRRERDLMDEATGRLLAAGCDDACFGARGSSYFLDFDREAESLGDAIGSAVKAVEAAGYQVVRVDVEEADAAR
jgi:hypothetical protein